jgi:hypothetical protein
MEPTETPTPTQVPCYEGGATFVIDTDKDVVEITGTPCPTETVTPTPTATPEATVTPEVQPNTSVTNNPSTDTTEAPKGASCTVTFDAPKLQGFTVLGNGSVAFSWWGVPNVDKYSIIYGYTPDSLIYGEDNIPASSTSITLNGLQPGNHVWAKVGAWRNGCEEESNILDPKVR